MAVRTSCPHCAKPFSAPEEYLGRKVDCPRCGKRSVLRSQEEVEDESRKAQEERHRLQQDREKIAFLEELEHRGRSRGNRYYHGRSSPRAVRNFDPNAPSQYLGLRALSNFLIVGAYFELFLIAVGMGLSVFLWLEGRIASTALLVSLLVVWLVVGTALFLLLKSVGEFALVLAEGGDRQVQTIQLLRDLRENTEAAETLVDD